MTSIVAYCFVSSKNGLFEVTEAIKLSCNYANPDGVPGSQVTNNRCRRCSGEKETIQHVLGACAFGLSRRTARHAVKHEIAAMLSDSLTLSKSTLSFKRKPVLALFDSL